MFTGIVETTGVVASLIRHSMGGRLRLGGVPFAAELGVGESVAVNGCCLTVVEKQTSEVEFDLLEQTLAVTNLGSLTPGDLVNLERAMLPTTRFSGHFVQGHVDATATVLEYSPQGQDHRLTIALEEKFRPLVIPKGSIAVDGMSLTIAELAPEHFSIWITPHTHQITTLARMQAGRRVNVEFDMLGKYLQRMLELRGNG